MEVYVVQKLLRAMPEKFFFFFLPNTGREAPLLYILVKKIRIQIERIYKEDQTKH